MFDIGKAIRILRSYRLKVKDADLHEVLVVLQEMAHALADLENRLELLEERLSDGGTEG